MDQTPSQVISQPTYGHGPGHKPAWHQDAACAQVGGDWWFPDDPHERISGPVLRICADCPVRRSCLLFALSVDVLHGVWAAMVPAELWALRQRVLDGEPAATVVADGLATGDARRANREGIAYRAAPWNPALGDLDHQIELVARWSVTATDDVAYEAGSAHAPAAPAA
jgi:hypothetical protein